jgi:hypothetical protein
MLFNFEWSCSVYSHRKYLSNQRKLQRENLWRMHFWIRRKLCADLECKLVSSSTLKNLSWQSLYPYAACSKTLFPFFSLLHFCHWGHVLDTMSNVGTDYIQRWNRLCPLLELPVSNFGTAYIRRRKCSFLILELLMSNIGTDYIQHRNWLYRMSELIISIK